MTTLQVGPLQLELRSRTYEIAERIDLSQSVVSTLLDKAITAVRQSLIGQGYLNV